MKKKRVLVQCSSLVSNEMIRRESINGAEHIVITSYTLPADIVMNGILYPQEERDKSYKTLERTLAPVEHPQDGNGNFISASDPEAIHEFHAGAFNGKVEIDQTTNRVKIDKFIKVQEAMKTERGKRLLDRINEIETSKDPRPIHTSVGVFLQKEELDEPQTNADGMEYYAIARDMFFDHDAILLDSVGAAQPHQGVGIGINSEGEELEVIQVNMDDKETTYTNKAKEMRDKVVIEVCEMSFGEIVRSLNTKINPSGDWSVWVEEVWNTSFVYSDGEKFFQQFYKVSSDGDTEFVGPPEEVRRETTFTPVNNQEGDAMKERMIAELKAAGISVNADISDDELFAKYQSMVANQTSTKQSDNEETDVATIVANAVQEVVAPLKQEIADLKANKQEAEDAETDRMVGVIVNSGRYPDLEADDIKSLKQEKIRDMYAKSVPSHGLPVGQPEINSSEDTWKDFPMPE